MPELRKDYILDRYVIIATERGKRPDQFMQKQEIKKPDIDYFGPGNEHLTPAEIGRYPKNEKNWQLRWFPNKFAAVVDKGNPVIRTDNEFFTFADAFGYHEVIVEDPDINKQLADVPVERMEQLLRVYAERIAELSKKPGIKYVDIFKNHGEDAGTSLLHTHSQVIAYNDIPQQVLETEKACEKFSSCPYERIINIEKTSFRAVKETPTMVCFTPYASKFPLEIVIFPKRFVLSITEFNDAEYKETAEILKKLLLKLQSINAPYNIFLQYGISKMRFRITIAPRLAKWAGFELSTGTIINAVPPEEAAKFYRS
ncbi:galactose-1-phosphate uridylyltransferase [Candidatus Woesearchaeota archaeon]|nr:MAG: galactose-1-phosphate uridylyltransferase [Candidatus Woesearchaeota archaeon]